VDDVDFEMTPTPPWSREGHLQAVQRAREHIIAGDIFQVVLSQRFDQERGGLDPLDVYRVLRVTNPSPYMYLLELPSATLVGASPEVLVRVDRDTRRITVRPIAGTRPRGEDEEADRRLEADLLADPKERAEHLMLIDLGRNDVGRVSAPGTVRVGDSFEIERYSRVMHIVSEVSGELRPEIDALDALSATFPAGTLSGAPKVRALEIIDELEPAERGWYGGAVGYLGYDGGADFAICIRSLVAHQNTVSVQAGGGIVFDSIPEAEDRECRNKASAVLRAVAMAKAGRAP
jgi:anthranilate synthase component 1